MVILPKKEVTIVIIIITNKLVLFKEMVINAKKIKIKVKSKRKLLVNIQNNSLMK